MTDPTALYAFLDKGGLLAALTLYGLVASGIAIWCLRGWLACYEARITSEGRLAVAAENLSKTSAAVAAGLESRVGQFEKLSDKVDDTLKAVAVIQQAIVSKLDTILEHARLGNRGRGERE